MKRLVLLTALSLAVLNSVAAQTQDKTTKPNKSQSSSADDTIAVRGRVVGDEKLSNHVQKPPTESAAGAMPAWGNNSVPDFSAANRRTNGRTAEVTPVPQLVRPVSMPLETRAGLLPAGNSGRVAASAEATSLNSIYRVGIGDVLDIRLLNLPSRQSTLYTVLKGGVIEYPLVTEPVSVDGLTTEQIAGALATKIKVIQTPRVFVTVRDYASHAVTVTGLVDSPGRKILRREALPLYAVLAEALPRADGSVITITRANGKTETISTTDSVAMASLVFSDDAIKVAGEPAVAKRFLYVGGDVSLPGEKEFREGITLTQVLLAAGGTVRANNNVVTVGRLNANGFLTSTQYDLLMIQQGKIHDPLLEPGDRIEVARMAQ